MKKQFLILFLILVFGLNAGAHAFLDHAEPRVGSTVTGPPIVVKIWFTEQLEGAFSNIQVLDGKGQEVDQGDAKLSPGNATLMIVSVRPLPAGIYKVSWHATATDTHQTTGIFTFTVK